MKLDGFGIFVDDMKVMIDFYRDVLGFEITTDPDEGNMSLMKDGTLFMFFGKKSFEEMTDKKFSYAKGINAHFEVALSVENYAEVDKEYERVMSMGARSVLAPTTEPWGQRTCFIADPEGNQIEIGSFNP